jgi:hypothetical protein
VRGVAGAAAARPPAAGQERQHVTLGHPAVLARAGAGADLGGRDPLLGHHLLRRRHRAWAAPCAATSEGGVAGRATGPAATGWACTPAGPAGAAALRRRRRPRPTPGWSRPRPRRLRRRLRPQHAGFGCCDLDVDLVGLQLHHRFVGGDAVTRILQPLGNRGGRHARPVSEP